MLPSVGQINLFKIISMRLDQWRAIKFNLSMNSFFLTWIKKENLDLFFLFFLPNYEKISAMSFAVFYLEMVKICQRLSHSNNDSRKSPPPNYEQMRNNIYEQLSNRYNYIYELQKNSYLNLIFISVISRDYFKFD